MFNELFAYMVVAKSVERNVIANLNEYSYGANEYSSWQADKNYAKIMLKLVLE